MPNIILFDNDIREKLLPLTFTRPMCELRVGILRIREKWEKHLKGSASFITHDYLAGKYGIDYDDDNFFINGSVMPSPELVTLVKQMEYNEAYLQNDELIAARLDAAQLERLMKDDDFEALRGIELYGTPFLKINQLTDLFRLNGEAISADIDLLKKEQDFVEVPPSNFAKAKENIFMAKGAEVEGAFLNATEGPIYIGPQAKIMEGSMLRGPVAIGEHATVRMGTKIYGGTTVGPWCKAGGEIVQSVLLEYANKAHDGFLGHSYLGAWTNLGADTNTSNLKNDYSEVRLWSYSEQRFLSTGEPFCGLIMGDHSKTAINTSLNTGTVVGVSCNLFGEGFPRNFVPSFAWGGAHGFRTYAVDKAFETMNRVMNRRDQVLDSEERLIMLRIFEDTEQNRHWEKK